MLTVYSKPGKCVQCDAVKRWLDKNHVKYVEKNALDHMEELEETGIRQMPIVVTENGYKFGGFDVVKLQQIKGGG